VELFAGAAEAPTAGCAELFFSVGSADRQADEKVGQVTLSFPLIPQKLGGQSCFGGVDSRYPMSFVVIMKNPESVLF